MTTDMGLAPSSFPLPRRSAAVAELLLHGGELPSLSDERGSLSDQQVSQAVLAATSLAATSLPDLAAFIARLNDLRVEKQLSYDRLGRRCWRRPELRLSRSAIYKMLTTAREALGR